jgi:hypothetical protein
VLAQYGGQSSVSFAIFVPEEGNKAKFRNVTRFSQKETIDRDYFMCHANFIPVSLKSAVKSTFSLIIKSDI